MAIDVQKTPTGIVTPLRFPILWEVGDRIYYIADRGLAMTLVGVQPGCIVEGVHIVDGLLNAGRPMEGQLVLRNLQVNNPPPSPSSPTSPTPRGQRDTKWFKPRLDP